MLHNEKMKSHNFGTWPHPCEYFLDEVQYLKGNLLSIRFMSDLYSLPLLVKPDGKFEWMAIFSQYNLDILMLVVFSNISIKIYHQNKIANKILNFIFREKSWNEYQRVIECFIFEIIIFLFWGRERYLLLVEIGQNRPRGRPRQARGICLAWLDQTKKFRWLGLTKQKISLAWLDHTEKLP